MPSVIKLAFTDFWTGFNVNDNWFTTLLGKRFNIEISDNPDFLIYSCYGTEFLKFKGIRIFYTGENTYPDFRLCDYAFSFDRITDEKNYWLPIYRLYFHESELSGKKDEVQIALTHSKFCNMVVSNRNARERINFYHVLTGYKKVDSGGRYLNNIGGAVLDKRSFIRNYKFTIAFENSSYPGYTTEKIVEPWLEGSIPIYWGNPAIKEEINPECFIYIDDYSNYQDAAEFIKKVDQNDSLYHKFISAPLFTDNIIPENLLEENILNRFEQIFDSRGKVKPVSNFGNTLLYYFKKLPGSGRIYRMDIR